MHILKKIKGRVDQVLFNNPIARAQFQKKRKQMLTRDFLSSPAYEELFLEKVSDRAAFNEFLDDAQQKTPNFMYRHQKMHRVLGAWRWKGLFLNRNEFIPCLFDSKNRVIDFGGAFGPVSQQATIVDFARKDVFGNTVNYHDLSQVNFQADIIFSSHTFEHIKELERVLRDIRNILKPGGQLILNLPAYSCIRWQHGVHTNKKFNDHYWTFILKQTQLTEELPHLMAIDELIEKHFEVLRCNYTGDNSIFIWARK